MNYFMLTSFNFIHITKITTVEEEFDEAAKVYQADFTSKGYKHQLEYEADNQSSSPKRNRGRRI